MCGNPLAAVNYGDGEVGDVDDDGVENVDRNRHADGVHPADHEQGGCDKAHQGSTVGDHAVVGRRARSLEGSPPDTMKMLSAHPDRPYGEHHHGSVALEVDDFDRFGLLAFLSKTEIGEVHTPDFEDGDDAEEPEAEQDVQVAKVGETHDRGHHTEDEVGEMLGDDDAFAIHTAVESDGGKIDGEVPGDVPEEDDEHDGEAGPEDGVLKDGGNAAWLVEAGCEFYSELSKWKGEPFVVFPLALEDDGYADAGCQHREGDGRPPEDGLDPTDPGDALTGSQAVVEGLDDARGGVGERPPGQDVEECLLPSVFGGGVVAGDGHRVRPVGGPSFHRNGSGDPGHAVDDDQFGAGQGGTGPEGFERA